MSACCGARQVPHGFDIASHDQYDICTEENKFVEVKLEKESS